MDMAERAKEPIGPVEALNLALKKEIEAHDLYIRLANDMHGREVGDIFINLANEEVKHRKLIEDMLRKIRKE